MKTGRLQFIDGLRGLAALSVVAYHLVGRTTWSWTASRGYLGVGIFFVLSGFVIASVMGTQTITPGYFWRFVARRAVRLDVPYWLSIAVMIPVALILKRHVDVPQVLSHMVYLQDFLGFEDLSPIYWTLCFEIQFYLTLLALLWAAQRVGPRSFYAAFLLTILVSALENAGLLGVPRGAMFGYWWAFALGATTYWTISRKTSTIYFGAVCVMVLAMPRMAHLDWRVIGVVTAVLMLSASRLASMNRWLSDPVSQFFGRISYSMYLLHPILGWFAQSLLVRHTGQLAALAGGVVVSVLSAWIAYLLIERPAIELSHKIRLTGAPSALPVSARYRAGLQDRSGLPAGDSTPSPAPRGLFRPRP